MAEPTFLFLSRANTNNSTSSGTESPQFSNLYTSTMITGIIACLIPLLALMFLAGLSWTYHYALLNPRPLNKRSGYVLQRYAPYFYVFLVLTSLAEVADSGWLIWQYRYHDNYPNIDVCTAARLLLFTASWTALTGGIYAVLFIHPAWSTQPISSIGAQLVWILVTWIFWIVGSGILNAALPSVLLNANCVNVTYCGQLQFLFGLAVIESLVLTAAAAVLAWLAWRTTRDTR